MAEPTASAVAWGLVSGIAGAALLALGVSWPLLTWAALGCVVGLSWAPAVGRWRAMVLFVAAAMLSAKAGAVASALVYEGSEHAGQGIAALMGCVFHPALTALINLLPEARRALVARLGGKS